ncbi:MAG TPA: enoyl-CoA hydratase-related protein [Pseudomonadales bacterium]
MTTAPHEHSWSTLAVSQAGEGILLVTLNRPDVSNALDTAMTRELLGLWQSLSSPSAPYDVVVLTGAGTRSFCGGADLKERNGLTTETWLQQHRVLEQMMIEMHACPLPVIAAVNGAAFGGGLELVLNCDFAYGCAEARFAFPEPKLGFIPGAMGTQWLPRKVGIARAMEICMTCAPFSAEDALEWGLLNRLVPQDALLEAVLETAARIRAASPFAVRQVKNALRATLTHDLVDGYRREIELYDACIHAPDRLEGISAFNEKRAPRFSRKPN